MHTYACLCVRVCVSACACLACCFILETSLGFFVSAAASSSFSWRTQLFHKNSLTFNFSKQQLHESEKCMKKVYFYYCANLFTCAHAKPTTTAATTTRAGEHQRKQAYLWGRERERETQGEPRRECLSVCESGGTRLYAWVAGKGAVTGGSTLRSAMLNLEVISVSLFVRYSLVRCHCTCIQM